MVVSARGADLHYTTRGTGPACLVLSAIGTKPYERMTPAALSDRLTLVYADLRGGGQSTGDAASLTFDALAEDLEAIRTDLGVTRVAVLGHSILGMLAIEYGRRCPASVSHVIAVGMPPFGDMIRVSTAASRFFDADASEDRKGVLRDNLARLAPDASRGQVMFAQTPTRFFDARVDAARLFAEAVVNPAVLGHILGTLAPAWDVTVGLESLRVATLLAHGRYDYTVPWTLWDGVAARLPNTTLHVFERSGHQPFFEEPGRFAEVLTGWMGSHP
jgi:proline iminopeptidase